MLWYIKERNTLSFPSTVLPFQLLPTAKFVCRKYSRRKCRNNCRDIMWPKYCGSNRPHFSYWTIELFRAYSATPINLHLQRAHCMTGWQVVQWDIKKNGSNIWMAVISLFFMSHCVICHPARRILYHVTKSSLTCILSWDRLTTQTIWG